MGTGGFFVADPPQPAPLGIVAGKHCQPEAMAIDKQ